MVDRQDIDALLIGALYGELTPAEEARLQTHLESHPGDRSALDGLKSARQAVRDSRIFDVQAEPPQAISALLLQEAHRRAPRRAIRDDGKDSWLARFLRSFVMHPAMAAAATLVLVLGVAGTLYVTKGGPEIADKAKEMPEAAAETKAPAPTVTAATAPPADTTVEQRAKDQAPSADQVAAGSSYRADVIDGKDLGRDSNQVAKTAQVAPSGKPIATHKSKQDRGGIIMGSKEPQPKDLPPAGQAVAQAGDAEGVEAQSSITTPPGSDKRAGGVTGNGFAGPAAVAPRASAPAAPPPPPAATPAPSKAAAPARLEDDRGAATPAKQDAKPAESIDWAKSQHASAVQAVRNKDCAAAASLVLAIRNRAPDFYNSYVATDRQLNPCRPYINSTFENDAERTGKARAAKRANEPAPADNAK
jgi:hypothetical protein